MKLEEYLRCLIECPDELIEFQSSDQSNPRKITLLEYKYSIYDNWPILLNHDFNGFLEHLNKTLKWTFNRMMGFDSQTHLMYYNHGTVEMQVFKNVPLGFVSGGFKIKNLSPEIKAHKERQLRDFNMCLMLHDCQEKRMPGVASTERAMAIVIGEIGEYCLNKNIRLCFPKTRPKHVPFDDCSYIVYYP